METKAIHCKSIHAMGALVLTLVAPPGCSPAQGEPGATTPAATSSGVQHLNPEGLPRNPAYSQAVVVSPPARTVYIGGQNAVDASDTLVARGDLKGQTTQVLRNIETIVAAAGGKLENVIKWNIHIVAGQSPAAAFEAFQQRAAAFAGKPPAITVTLVSGLARPDALIEMEAVAVVP